MQTAVVQLTDRSYTLFVIYIPHPTVSLTWGDLEFYTFNLATDGKMITNRIVSSLSIHTSDIDTSTTIDACSNAASAAAAVSDRIHGQGAGTGRVKFDTLSLSLQFFVRLSE